MNAENDLLADLQVLERRRKMIPLWIKIFIWIFIVFGGLAIASYVWAGAVFVTGGSLAFKMAFFGLETTDPFSPIGIAIFFLFALKGTAAWMMWTEKDQAITVAIVDAFVGLVVSICVMAFPELRTSGTSFPLETILLVPYLIKIWSLRKPWASGVDGKVFRGLVATQSQEGA